MSHIQQNPEANNFPSLTGLRGFAALWVLAYHAWVTAGPRELTFSLPGGGTIEYHPIFGVGWAGVQIFFTLSAFLLTLPFAETAVSGQTQHFSKRIFFSKRLIRVFPAYYLQLLVLIFLAVFTDSLSQFQSREALYFLTMNFMPEPLGFGDLTEINGVWWTLPIELSFYLLVPWIAPFAMRKHRWVFFCGCILIMIIWRYGVVTLAAPDTKALWFSQLPGSRDSFAIGMLTALIFVRYRVASNTRQAQVMKFGGLATVIAILMIIALIYWLDYIYWIYRTHHVISYIWTPLLSACFATLIFFSAAKHRSTDILFANRLSVKLGVISYGVYLWHLPVAKWFSETAFAQSTSAYLFPHYLVIMLLGASALATLSWITVERPLIRYIRAFSMHKKSGP